MGEKGDPKIATVTFISQTQSLSLRSGAPPEAGGSRWPMPLLAGRGGHSVGSEECQVQSLNRSSHLSPGSCPRATGKGVGYGVPVVAQQLTRNHEVLGSIPAPAQGIKNPALP